MMYHPTRKAIQDLIALRKKPKPDKEVDLSERLNSSSNENEGRLNERAPDLSDYESPNLRKYLSGNPVYRWHLRQFMREVETMLRQTAPRDVLDAGCGEGFVTRFLRQQNEDWSLSGVDLSEKAIAYARRCEGPADSDIDYRVGDLYELPFADDSFDTVLCSEVLEHLEHPGRAFGELRRVARQWVVVSVPREPYFRWLNDPGRSLGLSPDPGHVNFWGESGFRRFVSRHLRRPRFATKHVYQLARGRVAVSRET